MSNLKSFKSEYHLLKSFFKKEQVSYLILYITNRCNFRCGFCFYYEQIENSSINELSLGEIEKIAKNIGPLIQLSLTGGEPFLRKDITKITSYFIDNTFVKYITIPTNGFYTKRIIEFLMEVANLYPSVYFRIVLSVEGVGDIHDKLRGTQGSFLKLEESYHAIKKLKKEYPNIVLDANTVFFADSETSILDTLYKITDFFDFDNYSITFVRGKTKNKDQNNISLQRYVDANNFMKKLERTKEKRFLYPVWRAIRDVSRDWLIRTARDDEFITPCTAGQKLLVIAENGDVFPCEILERSFGNLRDFSYDIKKMLSFPESIEYLTWIKDSQCRCTFECAIATNILWGKRPYKDLIKATFKNIG